MKYLQFFDRAYDHVSETREIADLVLTDLIQRGANPKGELECNSGIHIDFGGCIRVGNPWQTVPTRSGYEITFFYQHYSLLRAAVNKALIKGDRGGYFKIHADRFACLTPETFEDLVQFLDENADRLLQDEVAESERFYEALADVKRHPNVG